MTGHRRTGRAAGLLMNFNGVILRDALHCLATYCARCAVLLREFLAGDGVGDRVGESRKRCERQARYGDEAMADLPVGQRFERSDTWFGPPR